MLTPSLLAHGLAGLIVFFAIVYMVYQYATGKEINLQVVSVMILFSIAVGIHGISHLLQEAHYNWNPLNFLVKTDQ